MTVVDLGRVDDMAVTRTPVQKNVEQEYLTVMLFWDTSEPYERDGHTFTNSSSFVAELSVEQATELRDRLSRMLDA